jgi:hypothetical protein
VLSGEGLRKVRFPVWSKCRRISHAEHRPDHKVAVVLLSDEDVRPAGWVYPMARAVIGLERGIEPE